MLDILLLKTGYREEANKRGPGVQGVGDLDLHLPPINALVKVLAIGYSQRSLKSFPLRSNYDLRGPDN